MTGLYTISCPIAHGDLKYCVYLPWESSNGASLTQFAIAWLHPPLELKAHTEVASGSVCDLFKFI